MKGIHLFLAEGFEEIEALATVDVLRRAGIDVKTVSITHDRTVKGAHGIPVVADWNRDEFDGLDVEISAEGTVYAHADATLVMQILWNLFGNDLKYAAPYGSVSVMIRRDGGFAVVEFADEGQGMTSREMKRAFDRYYRAKTVMQSGKGGFGIGLCTAREFARAMGGDLTVCANKPRGCVFALRLPAGLPPAQNVDVDLGKEKME